MNRIAFVTVCCDKDKWSHDKIVTTKTKMESLEIHGDKYYLL